jgi:hypothetical protein
MAGDWQALTKLTAGSRFLIERVRLAETGIAIEGEFELPPLAQLSADDQTFVAAFVRCHGSIKQMEQFFGVSYPTVKARLNRIRSQLPFVEIDQKDALGIDGLLGQLERGELTARDVIDRLTSAREEKPDE